MDLYEELNKSIEKYQESFAEIATDNEDDNKKHDLQIAVIGRPNAGKSSFLNYVLKLYLHKFL